MTKRVHIDLLPKTPGGRHLKRDEIFADEVEIDNEITIKANMLRECVPGNPWFEGEDESEESAKPPKYLVRKSVDLRRIRSLKDRVEAIRSSPMVDARPRRSHSLIENNRSTTEGGSTPLRLPNRNDLLHTTSRRLSRIILSRQSVLFSPTANEGQVMDNSGDPPQIRSQVESSLCSTTPFSKRKSNIQKSVASPSVTAPIHALIPAPTTPVTQVDKLINGDPDSASDFRMLAEIERARLNILCGDWDSVMLEEANKIPEQALDAIRTTVCKCQLVLQKKIPFFLSLVDMADQCASAGGQQDLESKENQAPTASVNDLAGYWALVADEIARADASFERLRVWRDEGQWEASRRPITPARGPIKIGNRKPQSVASGARRVARSTNSKIPTRKTPPGHKIDLQTLPSGTPKALGQALRKSAKKSKGQVRSKFAEFLKSKRTAMQSSTNLSDSPLVIFGNQPMSAPNGSEQRSGDDHDQTGTVNPPTTAQTTHGTIEAENLQTPSDHLGTVKNGDSFVVPKQRLLTSAVRRSSRSVIKRPAPTPTALSHLNASADERSLGKVNSRPHVASTPIAAIRAAASLQFESTQQTPSSALRRLQSDGKSSISLSAVRPGTPRPPVKQSSFVKKMGSAIRSEMSSRRKNTPGSPFSTPPLTPQTQSSNSDRIVSPGRTTRDRKRISFARDLAHTPGGHQFGSGSPRESYPLTPANKSGSLVAADRVLRRRRNIIDALTPLGLKPVSRRSRGTPKSPS